MVNGVGGLPVTTVGVVPKSAVAVAPPTLMAVAEGVFWVRMRLVPLSLAVAWAPEAVIAASILPRVKFDGGAFRCGTGASGQGNRRAVDREGLVRAGVGKASRKVDRTLKSPRGRRRLPWCY